jgi:uncharacterized protein (UPF0332 family)
MPLADDLLEQANHLANRERKKPRQASLRRAVSTSYYALFHLLVWEATQNWKRVDQRAMLARFFEHGKMKDASEKQRGECGRFISARPAPSPGNDLDCMRHLEVVAAAFSQSQHDRHTADYDNSKQWTRTEAMATIGRVTFAFQSWRTVRKHRFAQAYLISLLGKPRGV